MGEWRGGTVCQKGKINKEVTMKSHTYYDILGVSRDATLEEITSAKNALAKVYHPDANLHKDIDTTAFMKSWKLIRYFPILRNAKLTITRYSESLSVYSGLLQ